MKDYQFELSESHDLDATKELANLKKTVGEVPKKQDPNNVPNYSEFQYDAGESKRNSEEATQFAKILFNSLNNSDADLLKRDPMGKKGEHIFGISFFVDMVPVTKKETENTIDNEFSVYSEIASCILSQENYDFLKAVTINREGGYDSVYNAKLGFNRAMNAIVSTYLIGNMPGIQKSTEIATALSNIKTLQGVLKVFKDYKRKGILPNYCFTIAGDGFGQTKSWGERASYAIYEGQFDIELTKKSKGYFCSRQEGSVWYREYDPRTNAGGMSHGYVPSEQNPTDSYQRTNQRGIEMYTKGKIRHYDKQGNYIYNY